MSKAGVAQNPEMMRHRGLAQVCGEGATGHRSCGVGETDHDLEPFGLAQRLEYASKRDRSKIGLKNVRHTGSV